MTFFTSAKVVIRDPRNKDRILLAKRTIQNLNFYEPAGGRVEINPKLKIAETLEECAIREIKEELGCIITLDEYVGSYYFFWSIAPENCSICALFLGTILSQDPMFQKNEDETELLITPEWVNIYDILEKRICINSAQVGLESLLVKMIQEKFTLGKDQYISKHR